MSKRKPTKTTAAGDGDPAQSANGHRLHPGTGRCQQAMNAGTEACK